MKRWTIRRRVLAVALLPAVLVALALGSYFTITRIADLREAHQALGQAIVSQLAPASEFGVFTRNRNTLRNLADAVLHESGVEAVAIRADDGTTLAAAARAPAASPDSLWGRLVAAVPVDAQLLVFTAPIVVDARPLDELGSLEEAADGPARATPRPLGTVVVTLSQRRLAERQLLHLATGALMTLGLLAAAALLALAFARSLDAPLRRVTHAVRRFRDGELGARVPELSGGELGDLERGVNSMADAISQAHAHLQEQVEQATDELRQTLEAVEIKNVELDLARKRAQAASRVKSEFLANMSHEIRTPMNAIVGYTRLLGRSHLDGDQQAYVGTIERASASLLDLLEDVLDLSRIEAGKAVLDQVEFDVLEVIDHLFALHAPAAYAKGLELVLDADRAAPDLVVADAGKLQQVINNLLHNAIKFTDRGSISVQVRHGTGPDGQEQLAVTVADTGRGIPPEARASLFAPFAQLQAGDQRREGGVGLGLAISRRLVEAMGGTLDLESGPVAGSVFRLCLPVRVVSAAPASRPMAEGLQVVCCLASRPLATALTARLARWGAVVASTDALDAARDALAAAPEAVLILALDSPEGPVTAAAAGLLAAHADRRSLILLRSADREEQRRLARRLGVTCLPDYVGDAALRAELLRLTDRREAEPPDRAALVRTLAALDAEVLTMLGTELPVQHAAFEAALVAGDQTAAAALAHRLHGSAAFCRLEALARASAEVERTLRAGGMPPQALRTQLGAALDAVLTAIPAAARAPAPAAAPGDQPLRGLRLVVADDNRINRELLERLLRLNGAEVHMAEDGAGALAALAHAPCDAMLLDLHMPGLSGLEVARRLRSADGPTARLPLLCLTANALPEARRDAEAAGFDAHLVKPVDESELVGALLRVVALSRSA